MTETLDEEFVLLDYEELTPTDDPFDELFDPPDIIASRPITGDGVKAIRPWLYTVEQHFGGQGLATCHYAGLIGMHANLKTFRVEPSDRELSRLTGIHRERLRGHAQRLVDAGLLVRKLKKAREKGTPYVLAERVTL